MEMYEDTIINNPLYEPFFPTYELKYLSLGLNKKSLKMFELNNVHYSEPRIQN